ncbi:hypothetical protein WICPIJ_001944 [Wickerhamomyces pijperi]|uniref:Uncharacterized protein n=1 Tax=Wickerhamomyces pijperi TaxID=599730 RepID=A0A9P8QAR0_WICPI|nr:hypothetical protein WICPIJ_001944 [Wickerhamomyces pijperi]
MEDVQDSNDDLDGWVQVQFLGDDDLGVLRTSPSHQMVQQLLTNLNLELVVINQSLGETFMGGVDNLSGLGTKSSEENGQDSDSDPTLLRIDEFRLAQSQRKQLDTNNPQLDQLFTGSVF